MNTLKQHLEIAKPFIVNQSESEQKEIDDLGQAAEEACSEAHRQLYEGFREGNPNVMVFTDDPKKPGKYISFADKEGDPCYREFVPGNSATDIGLRGVNPEFDGIINPTTVVHADMEAVDDLRDLGAPESVIDALDAVSMLNGHIIRNIVKPYLWQVAEEYGLKHKDFTEMFYPGIPYNDRAHTVTRVIMYHLNAKEGVRPTGAIDGAPLRIGEHEDKSWGTVDCRQTSRGLQYQNLKTQEWEDAGTEVAIFRGSAQSFIPGNPPPTKHRVVVLGEDSPKITDISATKDEIARIAIPTFLSVTRPPFVARPQTVKSRYQPDTRDDYF